MPIRMPKPASTSAAHSLTFTNMLPSMTGVLPAPGTAQEKMIPQGHPFPITEAGSDPPNEIENIILLRGTMDKESDDTSHATAIPIVTEGINTFPR